MRHLLPFGVALGAAVGLVWTAPDDGAATSPDEPFVSQPNEASMEAFSRRKQYVPVGSWNVAYIDEGSGPPVFLLHGCPFHAYQWRDVIPVLSRHHRVIAPDLLGLGDTQVRLTDDYRLPQDVVMVKGLMDRLGIARADFVGADHGAATVQLLMKDLPDRIRRAVLTNAEAYDLWPSKPEIKYLKLVVHPWTSPIFRFLLRHSAWIRHEVFSIAVHREEVFTEEVVLAYTRAHTSSEARWERLRRFFRWQLDPEHNRVTLEAVDGLRRFDRPTLLLWGKVDTNFGPEIAERLASDIPGAVGVEYLEESAHMPFQEEPEAYNAALLDFLGAADGELAERRAEWVSLGRREPRSDERCEELEAGAAMGARRRRPAPVAPSRGESG
jgi:pimeloyl-ACP methyl ester carboxylesterase